MEILSFNRAQGYLSDSYKILSLPVQRSLLGGVTQTAKPKADTGLSGKGDHPNVTPAVLTKCMLRINPPGHSLLCRERLKRNSKNSQREIDFLASSGNPVGYYSLCHLSPGNSRTQVLLAAQGRCS